MALRKSHTSVAALVLALGLTGFATAGCSKTASCSDFGNKLQTSVNDMNKKDPKTDPQGFIAGMQDVSKQVHDKANGASDQKVKDALNTFATDWDAFTAKFQAVAINHDTSAAADISTLATKIETDATNVTTVCK